MFFLALLKSSRSGIANDVIPNETLPEGLKTAEPIRYGMISWQDLFSARQLLCHGTSVEIYRANAGGRSQRGQTHGHPEGCLCLFSAELG